MDSEYASRRLERYHLLHVEHCGQTSEGLRISCFPRSLRKSNHSFAGKQTHTHIHSNCSWCSLKPFAIWQRRHQTGAHNPTIQLDYPGEVSGMRIAGSELWMCIGRRIFVLYAFGFYVCISFMYIWGKAQDYFGAMPLNLNAAVIAIYSALCLVNTQSFTVRRRICL